MKFTIDELTITLHGLTLEPGASSAHPLHALMRAILTAVPADPEGGDDACAPTAGNGTTPETAASDESAGTAAAPREFKVGDRVCIAASVDEAKYEGTAGPGFVAKMRNHLGRVGTVTDVRPDRGWFGVDVPDLGNNFVWFPSDLTLVQPDAATSADTPAPPVMTDVAIRAFLRSDERYRYRTAVAVAKHFDVPEREACARLESLCTEDYVKFVTRRDDGARLYCAI